MSSAFLLVAILFPMLSGAVLPFTGIRGNKGIRIYVLSTTVLTSLFVWTLIFLCDTEVFVISQMTAYFTLSLSFDGMGRFFAGIVSTLWVFTVLYAFEYMKHDDRQVPFFTFFTIAYGVTLGISMSANLVTLYLFYEFLTLTTVPLVFHPRTRAAVEAAKSYFAFSLGGAAFALVSIIYLQIGDGILGSDHLRRLFYVFGMMGFGVKAAVFPFYSWLPKASVAPTPVTALLHAVAVVKSGVFAVMRLTYFGYGTDIIKGTWAQYFVLGVAAFTVVFGATRAVKETHWKRRLAYSTVANLSYILCGVFLMTDAGLHAGLMHMAFHAEIKILAFFCAGAVFHQTGKEYVEELDGYGYRMPWTFGIFTVAALALVGIPPFAGFVSKWTLLTAAASDGTAVGYVGAAAILIAALLTAIYCLSVVRRAFFPEPGYKLRPGYEDATDPSLWMLIPMALLAVAILVTGLCGGRISAVVSQIVAGRKMW